MTMRSPNATVLRPVPYFTEGGEQAQIPTGPCRVEMRSAQVAALIWGQRRHERVLVLARDLTNAQERGDLLLRPQHASPGMHGVAFA